MGSDNSKSQEQWRRENTDVAVARALASQKKMFEAKYAELRQAQVPHNQNNMNANCLPNNYAHVVTHTSSPLYPSLPHSANNYVQTTAAYVNLSGTSTQIPTNYSSQFPPSAPTAPLAQSNLATAASSSKHSSTAQSIGHRQAPHPKPRNAHDKDTAQSIVDCVTCTSELGLQIYQCNNGHSSCNLCRAKNARCGQCSNFITAMRNISLEATIADIRLNQNNNAERIRCPNSKDGCRRFVTPTGINNHLKECLYKDIICPLREIFGTCSWKGKINQLVMHFNDFHQEHRVAEIDKEMTLRRINVNQKVVNLVDVGPFNFLIHLEIDGNQNAIYMVVQLYGTKACASKWTYELHVYNKKEPRRKYQYISPCHSNGESVTEIFSNNMCAVLDLDYAKTFLDGNLIRYKFYIKKGNSDERSQHQ